MSTLTRVSDATGRITRRRREGRRRRWALIGVLAGLLAVLLVAGWLVLVSDVLGVRRIEVSGTVIAAADDVRRLADVPLGTPLARVDLGGVATKVAGLPAVGTVSVVRRWPDTLAITVTERTPMFALQTTGGYWIVDDQGVVFNSAAEPPRGLMVATVPGTDARLVRDLATVLRALPADLRRQVTAVGADTADSITLRLAGGLRVVWGSAQQSELKARVLAVLRRQKGQLYDVSAPSSPTVK